MLALLENTLLKLPSFASLCSCTAYRPTIEQTVKITTSGQKSSGSPVFGELLQKLLRIEQIGEFAVVPSIRQERVEKELCWTKIAQNTAFV